MSRKLDGELLADAGGLVLLATARANTARQLDRALRWIEFLDDIQLTNRGLDGGAYLGSVIGEMEADRVMERVKLIIEEELETFVQKSMVELRGPAPLPRPVVLGPAPPWV